MPHATKSDIHSESVQSLLLQLTVRGQTLSSATGFVVADAGVDYLVTNWHVLSGRNAMTGEPLSSTGAEPDAVTISHNARSGFGRAIETVEPLWTPEDPDAPDRQPRWTGHPDGPQIDIAVLPLTQAEGVRLLPHQITPPASEVVVEVSTDVSVVGFPFGLTHGTKLAIWTRGVVATEFDVDYNDLPCFLIDARTRQGQSGSPVLYFRDTAGSTRYKNGSFSVGNGSVSQFLGIYSGRINAESDIGYVWRPRAIAETIAAARSNAGTT